jgi:hypothetical protein
MDDYMFKVHVSNSKSVVEATTYLEIFSYSVRMAPAPLLLLLL